MTTTFKDFIFTQMKRAGLKRAVREPIYKIGFPNFLEAFTHESFRSRNFKSLSEIKTTMEELNIRSLSDIDKLPEYNRLEFAGDKSLNLCITNLLLTRFPTMADGTLTFAFQKIVAEKVLYKEAEGELFFPHILVSPAIYQQAVLWKNNEMNKIDVTMFKGKRYNVYAKLLEDVCEAFCGALVKSVNAYTNSTLGPGIEILQTWAAPILDHLDFDPSDITQTKAVGIVLKELWETIYAKQAMEGLKFTNAMMFQMPKLYGGARAHGLVPIKALDPITKQVVGSTEGVSEQEAREKAARIAVAYLLKYRKDDIEAGKAYKAMARGRSML